MRSPAGSEVPPLGPGECHVWWARLDYCAPGHQDLLNTVERGRRERYLRDADRDRFTLGVVLTRLVLAAYLKAGPADLPIDRSCARCGEPHGRPRLADGAGPDFSVSHSGDLIAVAVCPPSPGSGAGRPASSGSGAGRSVGVDVEQITAVAEPGLLDATLSAAERQAFSQLGPAGQQAAFFRYWVRKEAVLKATGQGLSVPLTQLTVSGADQRPQLLGWTEGPLPPGTVNIHDLEAGPGYAASLAIAGPDAAVREWDAAALVLDYASRRR